MSPIMRTIDIIIRVEKFVSKEGRVLYRTHAIAGGDEVTGFGKDFNHGDEVMVFFDDKHNVAKMIKHH